MENKGKLKFLSVCRIYIMLFGASSHYQIKVQITKIKRKKESRHEYNNQQHSV